MLTIRYLVLALILALPATALAQLSPEDVIRLRSVGSVSLSPDGQSIAYTVAMPRGLDVAPGPVFNELRVVPFAGGDSRTIIAQPQTAGNPQWTADGRLAFTTRMADEHPTTQVYATRADGTRLERLTDAPQGVMTYTFAPDGQTIFYTMREPLPQEVIERRARGFDMIVAGENPQHIRLWAQPVGGPAQAVTPADMSVRDFAVSPDGRTIALQMTEGVDADDDLMFRRIYTVPATGGEPTHLVPTEGKLGPMSWSPDGRRLAYLSAVRMQDPLPHSVFMTEVGSGQAQNLTPGIEATVEWLQWMDNRTMLVAAVEGTRTWMGRLELADAAAARPGRTQVADRPAATLRRITGGGPEIMRALSVDRQQRRFAAAVNTAQHPNEVYAGTIADGSMRRLTDHNPWLGERRMARQETITWHHPDGLRLEGVLVWPLDYVEGQRYPLAILPHGGPEGISIDGWNTRALYPSHVMATEGYVVFKPNYRGSGGRGPAFTMANHRDLGGKEFEDVLHGIDYLVDRGLVDPARVGISGTSYGGYFSAWAGMRHSERFAAAITFAGLSNWVSFTGTTDIPHEMALTHWDQYWWESPGLHWDRSPVAWIRETRTPILVAHGLVDERVHPEQSIQLYNLLRLNGIPTGLVLYPREPHGLLEPAHQLDFMQRMISWFGQHLGNN